MISRRIQLSIFGVFFLALTLASQTAHAQYRILQEPTGSCPDYLTATAHKNVAEGQPPKYTLDKVQMQCIQGMCHRCKAKPDGTFDTTCTKGDADPTKGGFKTDIPCNYSVDDIFVTVLGVVKIIFALTGAIALLMFVVGGMFWVLSAGDPGKVKRGKDILVHSVIAIIITFGAGAIVTFAIRAIGGNIEQKEKGAIGNITFPVSCPVGGTNKMQCKKTSDLNDVTNMVCDYRELKPGQEGICLSACDYEDATDGLEGGDAEWSCQDINLLDATQQRDCKTGLCPGAANVKCCKI